MSHQITRDQKAIAAFLANGDKAMLIKAVLAMPTQQALDMALCANGGVWDCESFLRTPVRKSHIPDQQWQHDANQYRTIVETLAEIGIVTPGLKTGDNPLTLPRTAINSHS